jgi:hypothetical protein
MAGHAAGFIDYKKSIHLTTLDQMRDWDHLCGNGWIIPLSQNSAAPDQNKGSVCGTIWA